MVLKIVILFALLGLAKARTSPNADYAKEQIRSLPGSRYSADVEEDASLDVPALIQKYGYPQETHNLITSDGYILEMHRIPHGRDNHNKPGDRPAVLVMHGLLSSSADFLVLGPGSALAYILAEAGYDVWLGNARGNYYSRRHTSLNPDSFFNNDFWRFSWDTIGMIDCAAKIDYILERTGQKKIHYIGHSQGGTAFLALTSSMPEYNDKLISFQGLAPASYFDNNEVSTYRDLAPMENVLESAAFLAGMAEIFPRDVSRQRASRNYYCATGSVLTRMCRSSIISGAFDREYFNETLIPLFQAHAPAGASIRQVAHYGQTIRFNAFRRYNFNALTNLSVYGRLNPPEFDLSKVTTPSYLHYGLSDQEVNFRDVEKLGGALANTVGLYKIERESFNHFDFIWARDVPELVYTTVLKCLKDAESKL